MYQLQNQHIYRYIFKCLPDPARSTTETVRRPVPFPYHAHRFGKSALYHAEAVLRTIPFQYCAQYRTSSVRRTVQFQYHAHRYEEYNDHSTAYGTTEDFFQDHHTLHSYDWKNDNKTGQSSTRNQETSSKALLEHCMHVHQPTVQVCKPGESLALRKVKHPLNGRTSVNRLPLMIQDILSQYFGCFEGIGHFPGDPYKFHLKPEHKPA